MYILEFLKGAKKYTIGRRDSINKITILGAGISGISAAYHLKQLGIDSIVFEKNHTYGGLCDNFEIDGFTFDKFIHLSFSDSDYVKTLFNDSSDFFIHYPKPMCYYKGYWLKHPAQNNLYPLEVKEKVTIIKDFIERKDINIENIHNYEEWLKVQYGNYFAENFPMVYTEKYWTIPAKKLETKWVGSRMYIPKIEEVLEGAMTKETPNTYYAKEMKYPVRGGYKSFLKKMAENIEIYYNKEVVKIDTESKCIFFKDGEKTKYEKLILSLPLPEICKIIDNVPEKVFEAAKKLKWTSGLLISLGFNKPDIPKYLWFYIYDKEILSSRVYSPSLKSPNNCPVGCSSLQAEIYFSKFKPLKKPINEVMDQEIEKFTKIGLFKEEEILIKDIRIENYANIIFDHETYKNRDIIHNYLDSLNIYYVGRFGEWKYFWSDQALLSGKHVAEKILKEVKF